MKNDGMMIKVCGMREAENIQQVMSLGIDFMGLIFYPKSSRYVKQLSSRAGIVPDYVNPAVASIDRSSSTDKPVALVGVFVDDMVQNIVTRVYNFHLDYVQLHGEESPVMIENLRKTLVPDISPDIKIIKSLCIREADDVKRWREYKNCVDMFLFDTKCTSYGGSGKKFDWSVLELYDGDIPFLLSGGIGPDDVGRVKNFRHPKCVGIDLNSCFELSPALKDVEKLRKFINEINK